MYIGISFGLTWGLGAAAYAMGVRYEDMAMQIVLMLSMFAPLAAMLLTRLWTREGFRGMEPVIGLPAKEILCTRRAYSGFIHRSRMGTALAAAPGGFFDEADDCGIAGSLSGQWACFSTAAFGEEAGWRGYMYPKLEEKFGDMGACLIGGTVWAVWHFPMIAQGHTFGLDYPGAPYLGFLAFIPYCIGVGSIQWYLTKNPVLSGRQHFFMRSTMPT